MREVLLLLRGVRWDVGNALRPQEHHGLLLQARLGRRQARCNAPDRIAEVNDGLGSEEHLEAEYQRPPEEERGGAAVPEVREGCGAEE